MRILGIVGLMVGLTLGAAAHANADNYTKTKHPIMLVRGLGSTPYHQAIVDGLETGGAMVCEAVIPTEVTAQTRGDNLYSGIQDCLAECQGSGNNALSCDQVHILAFSQGGITSRVVLHDHPDAVASVTTFGSPHKGGGRLVNSNVTCGLQNNLGILLDGFPCTTPESQGAFTAAAGYLLTHGLLDAPSADPFAQLRVGIELSTIPADKYPNTFLGQPVPMLTALGVMTNAQVNAAFPAGLPASQCGGGAPFVWSGSRKIYLFSYAGKSILTSQRNVVDGDADFDNLLAGTAQYLDTTNDGLVETCSARFGKMIDDTLDANHLDLINQIGGNVGRTNIVQLFRNHVAMLKGIELLP